MLARRFTIVCLIMTVFGMGMAGIVAQAERPSSARLIGLHAPCALGTEPGCADLRRR